MNDDPLQLSRAPGASLDIAEPRRTRWTLMLVWFMRIAAIAWCVKGVMWWADILGILGGDVPFDDRRAAARAIAIGFAVTDLIAVVGLWMASVWGGLMWLLAITAEVILALVFPSLLPMPLFEQATYGGLIAIYLVLTTLAAREEDRF